MSSPQTKDVFIDTNVFISENYHVKGKTLVRLRTLSERGIINLYTTEINKGEIKNNIHKSLDEAKTQLEKMKNKNRVLKNIQKYDGLFDRI